MTINKILGFGIFFRVAIFLILIFFPIYHESLGYVTPISYYGKLSDHFIHSYVTEILSTNPCGNIFLFEFYGKFYNYIVNNIEFTFDLNKAPGIPHDCNRVYPGPFFGILLIITNYNQDNILPLAAIIFFSEIIALILICYYFENKISKIFILFYVLMPIPLVFGLMHIPDIFAYLFFSLFIFLSEKKFKHKNIILLLLLLLGISVHPLFFIIFIYLIILILHKVIFLNFSQYLFLLVILLTSVGYYFQYFMIDIIKNSEIYTIDNNNFFLSVISYIKIFFSKLLAIIGFQISESNNLLIVLTKSFCGIIFLLGIVNSIKEFRSSHSQIIIIYLIITSLFFAPNWRYILILSPFLFLNFYNFIILYLNKFLKK